MTEAETEKPKVIAVFLTEEQLSAIEDWRRRQPVIPSRRQAMSYFLDKALRLEGRKASK